MNISDIDKNFKVEANIDKPDIKFHNVLDEPFKVYGVFYDDGMFRRMPEDIAKATNNGVFNLHANTAGGRVRFKTDSSYIAVYAKMGNVGKMPHFALTASIGFDLYTRKNGKEIYTKTFVPKFDIKDTLSSVFDYNSKELREVTINFPLYSQVKELYIGLSEDAVIEKPTPYKHEKPIVYYGSSITQGGCASRPGTAYQHIITREFDCNHINLGFSGSARGEKEIADYIANLDMSMFVLDYDYNAPNAEHLKNTHEPLFKSVRNVHPDIPIIIMQRPTYYMSADEQRRLDIIKTTYNNAVAAGDKNVYLISGRQLMEFAGNEGTVDGTHPTDLGFTSMAKALINLIKENGLTM